MNILHDLERMGIPYPSNEIYLVLLDHGRGSITDIAQKAGLYRPLVYKNLQFLMGKGLITKMKYGKRWVYVPQSPQGLGTAFKELQASALITLDELQEKYERKPSRMSVSYHEGKSGIKKVFEEIIKNAKKGDVLYRYESPKDYKVNSKYYPEIYWKKATGQLSDIDKVTITNEKTAQKRTRNLSREVKAIPVSYDQFEYNITELISDTQVGFIDYDSETAVLINDKRFAEFQLKIFKLFFKKL